MFDSWRLFVKEFRPTEQVSDDAAPGPDRIVWVFGGVGDVVTTMIGFTLL